MIYQYHPQDNIYQLNPPLRWKSDYRNLPTNKERFTLVFSPEVKDQWWEVMEQFKKIGASNTNGVLTTHWVALEPINSLQFWGYNDTVTYGRNLDCFYDKDFPIISLEKFFSL